MASKQEQRRQFDQENTLLSLGFTRDEAEALRRISMTLHRWYEHECNGTIQRDGDDGDGDPFCVSPHTGKIYGRTPDRERDAERRLKAIVAARNERTIADQAVCPNCAQWQHNGNHGDCLNECVKRGFAPARTLSYYLQTDPRGAALYIIRPGDVPEGGAVSGYYSRGICVY